MFKKLNEYFICDKDEQPTASDLIFFYGFTTLLFIIALFFAIGMFWI